jgi:hypothetical protein
MFERRFADKLTYFDWKLGFLIDEKDIEILVDNPREFLKTQKTSEKSDK